MKTFRIAIALLFLLAAGKIDAQNSSFITVITLDTHQHYAWHLEGNKPATLTQQEIERADSILNVCIAENQAQESGARIIGTFIGKRTFMKQLVPSVNAKGEIIVWANCFIEPAAEWVDDWRYEVLIVNDGGGNGGFFNVLINLSTGKYSGLYINGI